VTAPSSLRKEPADPPRAKGPAARPAPAPLALLLRGERVAFLEARGEWSRVRASDGTEGWLRSAALLPADGVTEATVLGQAWAFDRPDLLAVNVRRKLDPGTLLLVVKSRELFSEVETGQGIPAWVLSENLTSAPEAVQAAKLVEKARWLARSGRGDEAREVLAVLRARLPGSPLAGVLAVELGEAPPPATPAAPLPGTPGSPAPGPSLPPPSAAPASPPSGADPR
jgi:SH3-like domain-containing protein